MLAILSSICPKARSGWDPACCVCGSMIPLVGLHYNRTSVSANAVPSVADRRQGPGMLRRYVKTCALRHRVPSYQAPSSLSRCSASSSMVAWAWGLPMVCTISAESSCTPRLFMVLVFSDTRNS
ncbi:hypothetical protein EYF80_023859 [Liparis tanakae]|uniref:Uncharacterized protein n=1 Tax=Liparis tanakae TaxID=230148 RepID=A0A4Z2HIW7_9TELE|nr:hypothetical protein EYF80_023859 [Liparis tanakae]